MTNLCNEFCSSMHMWKAGKNNRGHYRACRSRPCPITLNYQIFHWMWRKFHIWWVLGYVQASKTAVKPQKDNYFSFNYNRDLTGLQPAGALNIAASGNLWVLALFAPNWPPWPSSPTVDYISRLVSQRSVQHIPMISPRFLQIVFSATC